MVKFPLKKSLLAGAHDRDLFKNMGGPFPQRPSLFHQFPLYFFLVAIPPRIWRSALFSLSISLTCWYSLRLMAGRRSLRSLCTVITNQNGAVQPWIAQQPQVNVDIPVFVHLDLLYDAPELGVGHPVYVRDVPDLPEGAVQDAL